jgi:hypothetical protein
MLYNNNISISNNYIINYIDNVKMMMIVKGSLMVHTKTMHKIKMQKI